MIILPSLMHGTVGQSSGSVAAPVTFDSTAWSFDSTIAPTFDKVS